ncbi:MAG: choice-of-anchor J domain-containing protein, partial [Chitinophagales bacterium]
GTATDACSNVAPGKMYQDYMDYTQDACYSMFTKKQVERMEWVVNNARAGLITSLACQPPAVTVLLDALPFQSVNPGGMEAIGCTIATYPSSFSCGASSIQPKLRIKNNGLTMLTSITAGYRYDDGAAVSNVFVVNLPSGGTTVLTLSLQSLAVGSHIFKFFTSNPNGGVDQTPANDTLNANLTVAAPVIVSLPLTEQFGSATFPPTNWTITNPNAGSTTWTRWNGTGPTGTPFSSPGTAFIDYFSYTNLGHRDFLWSPGFSITDPADSVILSFRLAHRAFSLAEDDTLEIVYSTNCGSSWQRLGSYYKWSNGTGTNALATVTPFCNCDFGPASTAQWRQERIGFLPSSLGSPSSLMIGWKGTNDFGNNIFIDDINILAITVYTFIGTGNWSVASNWLNSKIPPAVLLAGQEIIINPSSGNSVKNVPLTLNPGSKLTVMPGKTLIVP